MSNQTLSSAADQAVVLQMFDGSNMTFTAADIDSFNTYNVQICISYGAQIGASLMLLIVMALIVTNERRRTAMFTLNALALLLNVVRLILCCIYYDGPWSEAYVYFAEDYDLVPSSAYAISVVPVIFSIFVLVCIEACLILQTQVVLVTLPRLQRQAVLVVSVLVATMTVAINIVYSVYNIRAVVNLVPDSNFDHLTDIANIVVTVSICWFSAIFTTKLGHTLLARRKMGIQTFGPMDILFIIGGQTMIVPAIFAIVSYATRVPSLFSNIITATAIFLPLSSLWASSFVENRRRPSGQSPRNGSASLIGSTARTGSNASSRMALKFKAGLLGRKRDFSNHRRGSHFSNSPTLTANTMSPTELRVKHKMLDVELGQQGI